MSRSDDIYRFIDAVGPQPNAIQQEMATYADDHQFPIIGPIAGGVLRSLARASGAQHVFEFGSGFGYSASWFLQGMPESGTIVLTEMDRDELVLAEEFLDRAGVADRAVFEHGDAMEIVTTYSGPFDIVLIDHQKDRYADAFAVIRDKVSIGSVIVADNMMKGPIDLEDLVAYVANGGPLPSDVHTRGIAEYLDVVRADDAFHTVVLPVGSGIAVTTRERT